MPPVIERANIIAGAIPRLWTNAGPPSSGTAGTFAGQIGPGDELLDSTNGVKFVNEGTKASPYYTPVSFDQAPLRALYTDWRDGVSVAIAGATMSVTLAGSGLRVFGDGHADNDSGAVINASGEGGPTMRFTSTNEIAHMIAIGDEAGTVQPDQHLLAVIDVEYTHVTDILERAMFIGFLGTAIDALIAPVTGATTVATLVQDDLAGLFMSFNFTDPDALFGVHNKSNAAATQDLTVDGDTGPTNVPAAATVQRLRVEIRLDTATTVGMKCFANKVQIYSTADALDEDEECSPVFYVEALDANIKTYDNVRTAFWTYR